jgi:hypothetical protein
LGLTRRILLATPALGLVTEETAPMTDLEKLAAIAEIQALKANYFSGMDLKRWDELAPLFTQDAVFDVRGALEMPKPEAAYDAEPVITGNLAIARHLSTALGPLISVHQGFSPAITILSPTTARGTWAMSDILVFPDGKPFNTFHGYGYYFDTYRREAGRWRIAELKLRRLYIQTT